MSFQSDCAGPINRQFCINVGAWQRISLLLELEHRFLNSQFSKALHESMYVALGRESAALVSRATAEA